MISDFKDTFPGGCCIIIGNGPSLDTVPREFLYQYPTFGQNKIYVALEGFTPTFYVTSDSDNVIDHDQIDRLECIKFTKRGLGFKGSNEFKLTARKCFSYHPEIEMYEGYSVTYISLQLAYYMGFETVLLVGVDHRYEKGKNNHAGSGYGDAMRWDAHSLEKGEREINRSMGMAEGAYRNAQRRIINLNPTSRMKIFEFGNISEWMPVGIEGA